MRFLSIQSKLVFFVGFICLLIMISCGLILSAFREETNKINQVMKENSAVALAIQGALFALSSESHYVEKALFGETGQTDAVRAEEKANFEISASTFELFIQVLTWGIGSKGFQESAEGSVYEQWKKEGWVNRLKIYEPSTEIQKFAGAADIYNDAAVKYFRQALEFHSRYEILISQGFLVEAEGVHERVSDSMRKALRYKQLGRESLRELLRALDRKAEGVRLNIISAQSRRLKQSAFILGGLFLTISCLTLFFSNVVFVKPILRLTEVTRAVAHGKFDVHIKTNSSDEIGQLGRDFDQMIGDLTRTTVSRDTLLKEIEDRKRMEKIVFQSEKLSAMGQLAAGVAHEINNPLGVILGFAQGVAKRISPNDPLELPLRSIEREALRCKELVQNLLTFSRTNKGDKEFISINKTIEDSLPLILAQAKVKNVQFVKEFESELPNLLANPNQVQQILINLANNAMDAMPDGGTLTFRTREAVIEGGKAIEIQTQDTGSGIAKDIQSKIFEPFFTTKEVGKGTGLGLSLVFEIVQKHHGHIELISDVGKGCLFKIYLPITG